MAAADVEAVAVLHLRSWRSAYRGMVPQAFLDGLTLDGRVARWAGALSEQETGEVHTIVAEDGALIVGVSSFGSRREGPASDGEIIALHVLPERRRQRIGSLLLDASIDALRARSFIAAVLWVLEANAGARRFYEAKGWEPTGQQRIEDRDGYLIPEVRYAKPI